MCLDPGNSTGWCLYDTERGCLVGAGTIKENHRTLGELITKKYPEIIVFESFNLYPGAAKSLTWNSFYPVEVIGIIKYLGIMHHMKLVSQAPGIKKFAGTLDLDFVAQARDLGRDNYTEHTKDSILHLQYYLRNNKLEGK